MAYYGQQNQTYDQTGYDDSPSQFAGQGGGFMGTQHEAQSSPQSPKGQQSGGIIQTLTPVTIRQLYNAVQQQPEDIFKVDGKELNQVTIVGQIVHAQVQSTNLELIVDDSTGKIEVRQWLEPDDNTNYLEDQRAHFKEGVYVRVVGHLRAFQQKRSIMAFRIQAIDDWNEITFHLLEAIHVHLFNTRGSLEGDAVASMPTLQTPQKQARSAGGGRSFGSLLNNSVMELLQSAADTKEGTPIPDLVATLADQFPEDDVRQAVEFLVTEGHAYHTMEDHVKFVIHQ